MNKYKIQFCPRGSWQPMVEPADQRWTDTPDVFTGTPEELTLHLSELDADFGFECNFRGVPVLAPELEQHHYCAGCGGDFRAAAGTDLACSCPREQQVDRWGGLAWTRETVAMTPGKEAAS